MAPLPQPRLIVKAGPTLDNLQQVHVNSGTVDVSSEHFEGYVTVSIADYLGPQGPFEGPSQPQTGFSTASDTWSIKMSGRFKGEMSADDIMWGNSWDKPIRDHLPYGTSAALKFVHLVDPSLTHDIYADKPWALSPLMATMKYISVSHSEKTKKLSQNIPGKVVEDVTPIFDNLPKDTVHGKDELEGFIGHRDKRAAWMNQEANRKLVKIDDSSQITADFCNGYIDFKTLSAKLPIGLSFPLAKYWDGQPVTFVARNRSGSLEYFFVTFSIVNDDSLREHAESEDEHAKQNSKADKAQSSQIQEDTLGVD